MQGGSVGGFPLTAWGGPTSKTPLMPLNLMARLIKNAIQTCTTFMHTQERKRTGQLVLGELSARPLTGTKPEPPAMVAPAPAMPGEDCQAGGLLAKLIRDRGHGGGARATCKQGARHMALEEKEEVGVGDAPRRAAARTTQGGLGAGDLSKPAGSTAARGMAKRPGVAASDLVWSWAGGRPKEI